MTAPDCQQERVGIIFSDRFWVIKLGFALGLLALLCRRADRELGELHPAIDDVGAGLENLRGKTIHAWARRVHRVIPDGVEIETKNGPLRLTALLPAVEADDYVSFTGLVAGPRHVVASVARATPGFLWKRGLNYGLSAATVLAFLWLIRRRFRWRLSEGLFRGRY